MELFYIDSVTCLVCTLIKVTTEQCIDPHTLCVFTVMMMERVMRRIPNAKQVPARYLIQLLYK